MVPVLSLYLSVYFVDPAGDQPWPSAGGAV